MNMKTFFLKKLYFHINKYLEENKDKNDIRNGLPIPESAIIKQSSIIGNVKVGEHTYIEGAHIHGPKVTIGDYTTLNPDSIAIHSDKAAVVIGKFCSIARKVDIQEWNHCSKRLTTSFFPPKTFGYNFLDYMETKGDIVIGNDVWVGAQSLILSGVTIGDGAIIGANTVVSKDVPPYAIAVGSPSKVVSYRFDEDVITKLLEIKWWDWDMSKLNKHKELFLKSNLTIDDLNGLS